MLSCTEWFSLSLYIQNMTEELWVACGLTARKGDRRSVFDESIEEVPIGYTIKFWLMYCPFPVISPSA